MGGRFLLQRPSGAIPERLALTTEFLVPPRDRKRYTGIAALIGLGISVIIGVGAHARYWIRGERFSAGTYNYTNFSAWLIFTALIITPLTAWPCYIFTNSTGATA